MSATDTVAVERSEVQYAKSGDVHIAYQIIGEGESDLVLVPEFWHSIEAQWDQPALADFLLRLSSFGRLISFDQRGTGVSDPVRPDEVSSLEQWLDDISIVMDEVGSKQAVLVGMGGGGGGDAPMTDQATAILAPPRVWPRRLSPGSRRSARPDAG